MVKKFINISIFFFKLEFYSIKKWFHLLYFVFLITVFLFFSLYSIDQKYQMLSILMVTIFIGSSGVIEKTFQNEFQSGVIKWFKLSNIPFYIFIYAKILVNFVMIICLEIFITPFITIFSDINIFTLSFWIPLSIIFTNLSFVTISTLFSAINNQNSNKIVAIIIYPLLFPIMMSTIKIFNLSIEKNFDGNFLYWVKSLIILTLIYIFLIVIFSEVIVEE